MEYSRYFSILELICIDFGYNKKKKNFEIKQEEFSYVPLQVSSYLIFETRLFLFLGVQQYQTPTATINSSHSKNETNIKQGQKINVL